MIRLVIWRIIVTLWVKHRAHCLCNTQHNFSIVLVASPEIEMIIYFCSYYHRLFYNNAKVYI